MKNTPRHSNESTFAITAPASETLPALQFERAPAKTLHSLQQFADTRHCHTRPPFSLRAYLQVTPARFCHPTSDCLDSTFHFDIAQPLYTYTSTSQATAHPRSTISSSLNTHLLQHQHPTHPPSQNPFTPTPTPLYYPLHTHQYLPTSPAMPHPLKPNDAIILTLFLICAFCALFGWFLHRSCRRAIDAEVHEMQRGGHGDGNGK